jgi:hypothetical protein
MLTFWFRVLWDLIIVLLNGYINQYFSIKLTIGDIMDGVLLQFFSISTLIFIIIVYLSVVVFRKLIETLAVKIAYIFPDKYEGWWVELWHEWVLLAAPSVIGGLIAFFVKEYPYPEMFATSEAGRVFFGIVAGLVCNNTYKFLKKKMTQFFPAKVEEEHKKITSEME